VWRADEEATVEEASLVLLHAEKEGMDLCIRLSPSVKYLAGFMFMAELWGRSSGSNGYSYTLRSNSGEATLVWQAIDDLS
jgi:hypothetical protein